MDIFDQILENLELERELGTRMVEIDRALLVPPVPDSDPKPPPEKRLPEQNPRPAAASGAHGRPASAPRHDAPSCDVAFFTGKPLSAAGMEAMEKIFAAIAKIKPDAVLCMNEERRAKVCVLLGSDALLKRNPAARPMRGAWTSIDGVPAIMTFSPDYIFTHFQEGSPRMRDAKTVMWNDVKSAVARLL